MPDNQDYEALGLLLASPENWSDGEARYMRSLLLSQTEAVGECHPKDATRRASMQALVDEVRSAIERYEAGGG